MLVCARHFRLTWAVLVLAGVVPAVQAADDKGQTAEDKAQKAEDKGKDAKIKAKGLKQDLARVQGAWRRQFVDQNGRVAGWALKEIEANGEAISYYDNDNKLLSSHSVTFELERAGQFRVFRHSPITITGGPDKGARSERGGRYVYRVNQDTFTETQGFLVGEEAQPPTIIVWKRLKEI